MKILTAWLLSSVSVVVLAYILPGIVVDGFLAAMSVALVFGLFNALVRPVLKILTLPINILTFGLFSLVLNIFIILAIAYLIKGFEVNNIFMGLLFSFLISVLNSIWGNFLTKK
ncbi:MAG: phage holin family protein [Candidatus Moranbacteria bacterium]|nr:phage holin family protein [Candidatus Moranbacteria bacterium]